MPASATARQQWLEGRFHKFHKGAKKVLDFLWFVTFGEAIALTPLRVVMAFMAGTFVALVTSAPWLIFLSMVGAAVTFGVLRWLLAQYKEAKEAQLTDRSYALERAFQDAKSLGVAHKIQFNQTPMVEQLQALADEIYGKDFYQVVMADGDPDHITLVRKVDEEKNYIIKQEAKKKVKKSLKDLTLTTDNQTLASSYQRDNILADNVEALRTIERHSLLLRLLKHLWNFFNRYSMYFWWMIMISMVLFTASIAALNPLFILLVPAILPGILLVKEAIKIFTKPHKSDHDIALDNSQAEAKFDAQALLQEWVQRRHVEALSQKHIKLKEMVEHNLLEKLQQVPQEEITKRKIKLLERPQAQDKPLNPEHKNYFAPNTLRDGLRYLIKLLTGFGLGYLYGCFIPWPFIAGLYLFGFSWVLTGTATIVFFSFATTVGLVYALKNLYGVFKENRARDKRLYTTTIEGGESALLSDYANSVELAMEGKQQQIQTLSDEIKRLEEDHNQLINFYNRKLAKDKLKDPSKAKVMPILDYLPKGYYSSKVIVPVTTLADHQRHTGISWIDVFLLESLIRAIDAEGTGIFFVRSVAMPGMLLSVIVASFVFNVSFVFHMALLVGAVWIIVKIAELASDYQQKRQEELLNHLESRVRGLEQEYTKLNDLENELGNIRDKLWDINQQIALTNTCLFKESYTWQNFLTLETSDVHKRYVICDESKASINMNQSALIPV